MFAITFRAAASSPEAVRAAAMYFATRTQSDVLFHRATHDVLSATLGVRVAPVGVVHPALYHLDLSLCPLDERRAIVAPDAWDPAGRATVAAHVPEPLVLDLDEAAVKPYSDDGRWRVLDRTDVRPWTDDYVNLFGSLVRQMRYSR